MMKKEGDSGRMGEVDWRKKKTQRATVGESENEPGRGEARKNKDH